MLLSTRLAVYAILACTLLSPFAWAQVRPVTAKIRLPTPRQADSLRRNYLAEQNRRTRDPKLGWVPTERLNGIRKKLIQSAASSKRQARAAAASDIIWTERGPLGFTGTLRTTLFPFSDPTGRSIWVGSTTGGLWANSNIADPGSNWVPFSDAWDSNNLSALANDPTNDIVAYAATGDPLGEGVGGGIWRTADRGKTWLRLSATIPSQTGTLLQAAFSRIAGITVTTTGLLLAGTQGGVLRSFDQGRSWQFLLAPQQRIGAQPVTGGSDRVSAIQMGPDEFVYVAMANGRLFRSNGPVATAWTEITPPATSPYTGLRTELTIAASADGSDQTLYAAQIAEDATFNGYTLRWLKKSTNSGQTWQSMTRPVYADAPDLDVTLGFGDKYFTLTASPDSARVVYMTAYDQLYRSGDGGTTWSAGQTIGRTTAFLPLPAQRIAWAADNQVYYAPTQQLVSQGRNESQHNRTRSFGGLDVAGVAMKNTAGSRYRLTGSVGEPGLLETADIGNQGSTQLIYPAYPLRPFIDQNEPAVQVAATSNGGFLTRNTNDAIGWDYYSPDFFASDYPDGGVDYDSRSNTLFFWSGAYRKATGIGTNPQLSLLDSGRLARPTCLKVGVAPNSLFAATINSQLYRITGTNQATPTLTRIDGGTFPTGSTISGIDVGEADNELIVSLSNYGVQSIWYTTNGGTTWTSKDLPAYGLPDLPVYAVLMNPTNRQQVMLATELGVWSTANITATNPAWVLTNNPAPLVRCKQLVYRASDEHIAVVTNGRGVWESDIWASDPPILVAGSLSTTALCAGSTFPVNFTLTNTPPSRVVVRLSNAAGDFTEGPVIAAGSSSPLSATVPTSTSSGTGYKIRLEAAEFSLTQPINAPLRITNLTSSQAFILDKRQTLDPRLAATRYTSGYVCPGDSALLRAYLPNQPTSVTATYRWALDGQPIARQTSATLLAGQTGTYSFTASVGSCTTINANDFLVISLASPTVSVLNPTNPDDGPICPGTPLPLGASYVGQRATYQWFRNGTVLPGATSPVLSITTTGAYSYSLTFSASGAGTCVATAPSTYLPFSPAILPPVIAVANDVLPTLCGSEKLTLYATSQPDSTTYQWLQDGRSLSGKTSSFVDVSQAGIYRLQIRRGTCLAVSDPIAVTANNQLSNGFYFYGSTTLCAGEKLVLYAKNTNHTLQWTKNNVPISGATGFSYTVDAPGSYGLRYTSGSCSGTAVAISVVFSQTLTPTLSLNEQCASAELSTRDFPRTGAVAFSWLRNGQQIAQGSQTYQTVTTSGLYSVSVTNGVCGGLSKPVSVTIGQPAKPTIMAAGGLTRCPNSAVELQRVTGPYSYWKKNGVRLDGATLDELVATETGVYSLVYEQGTCLTESAALSVVVNQPASATVLGRPFIRSGQSAVLPIQLSGIGPWSFSLAGGQSVVSTYQNPYSLTVTPSQTTSYSLVNLVNSCGAGMGAIVRVFVNGADVSLTSWVNKRYLQLGDSVTHFVRVTNAGPDVAENLLFINRLPSGLSYTGSLSANTGDSLRYAVGNVPVGESRTVSFRTRVNKRGTYLNAVEVIACDTPDPDSQPNTGFADGEDDTALTDFRTTDTTRYVGVSPNPNGRLLPAVAGNQPAPVANKADLSVLLSLSKRVAQVRDTIRVTMLVQNQGGASTSLVQTGLTLPNGTYSLDKTTWKAAGTTLTIDIGQINANATISRTVYWLPATSDTCRVEVTRSAVADPDSTPNNRSTRPGEDDEASADIRVNR
ncbi:hypothetical protein [uncultured Fibrella sp.]|uniref:hypothetical protein n=1 Tax=uncultured Fibrella sp. TaxID=1284596 RepID=UPI0035CA0556